MFGFTKKCFFATMMFFCCSLPSLNSLKYISMNNQECKVRPQIFNANSEEPVFFPFSIKTSKCSGTCNSINNPYAKLCVPDVLENLNVKAFNLMSRTNETRHIEWHKTYKCKCRLDASVCNNNQRWSKDKCKCECKELIDKGVCEKRFIWNSSNCQCGIDIMLFSIIFTANIGIGTYFVYCKYMNLAKETGAKESFYYQVKFDY